MTSSADCAARFQYISVLFWLGGSLRLSGFPSDRVRFLAITATLSLEGCNMHPTKCSFCLAFGGRI